MIAGSGQTLVSPVRLQQNSTMKTRMRKMRWMNLMSLPNPARLMTATTTATAPENVDVLVGEAAEGEVGEENRKVQSPSHPHSRWQMLVMKMKMTTI